MDIGSLDVLQGHVQMPVQLARLVDGDDVLMLELGGSLGFGMEPADQCGIVSLFSGEHLQRHGPTQLGIDGQKDRPHPAGS